MAVAPGASQSALSAPAQGGRTALKNRCDFEIYLNYFC